jgi:hypothetical protein
VSGCMTSVLLCPDFYVCLLTVILLYQFPYTFRAGPIANCQHLPFSFAITFLCCAALPCRFLCCADLPCWILAAPPLSKCQISAYSPSIS